MDIIIGAFMLMAMAACLLIAIRIAEKSIWKEIKEDEER